MQTEFILEWNNLLTAFNEVLFSIPKKQQLDIFILLINKINSNCRAAVNLISQGFINEGLMIFRSAIETVIYAKYLKLFPEEQKQFLHASDIFLIKNQFIQYKEIKNNNIPISTDIQILLQTIENNIKQLIATNELLRKKFSSPNINFDKKDIKLLEDFFQNQKFPSQNIHKLLKRIKEREPQFANTPFDFHSIYYIYYDENSTILHGNGRYWINQPYLNQYHLATVTSHLLRILIVATDLVKDEIPKDIFDNFERAIKKLKNLELKYLPTYSPVI